MKTPGRYWTILLTTCAFAGLASAAAPTKSALAAGKPNIVFIMADDLGWADVAFHQGNAPTPNLDKLARESVEFTQYYAAATCSPTRTALMTGRCWSRFGIGGPDNRRALPWDTVTLPRAMKAMGYETAITGKWHLGSKPDWGPNHFGFDHSYGSLAGGVGPWDHHYKEGEFVNTWHRNEKLVTEEGHVTDLICREAIQWLRGRGAAPFFLYVPFTAVHLPLKEPKEWVSRVPAGITGEVPRQYAASIMHLDDAVGQIVAALDQSGRRQDTLVVFTSDNGGSWAENNGQAYPKDGYANGRIPGSNVPWRGQKGDMYEGGIRVPMIVSWPGHLKPRKTDQAMQVVDWMPTFCAVVGYQPGKDLKWDGTNLWPHLTGERTDKMARVLYWTQGRNSAVRDGDWKLTVQGNKTELFDLAKDPYEKTDLAPQRSEQLAAMKRRLAEVSKADRDSVAKD